jgi:hypothetical protein
MGPDSPEYPFELQRVQVMLKASQDNLRIEREAHAVQLSLFERERESREARYRRQEEALEAELAAARRGDEESSRKGKKARR